MSVVIAANLPRQSRIGRSLGVALAPLREQDRLTIHLDIDAGTDPTIEIVFGLEQSFDGGLTWEHWISATTFSSARSQRGDIPSISRQRTSNDPALFRAFIDVGSQPVTVGLTGEIL
jgi:hypothetical protein